MGVGGASYLKEMETTAWESLDKVAQERISSEVAFLKVVVPGNPADELVRTASEQTADLICNLW